MEVDTVLATHELLELFDKFSINLRTFQEEKNQEQMEVQEQSQDIDMEVDEQKTTILAEILREAEMEQNRRITPYNSQSNGYLEYIFRRAQYEFFDPN